MHSLCVVYPYLNVIARTNDMKITEIKDRHSRKLFNLGIKTNYESLSVNRIIFNYSSKLLTEDNYNFKFPNASYIYVFIYICLYICIHIVILGIMLEIFFWESTRKKNINKYILGSSCTRRKSQVVSLVFVVETRGERFCFLVINRVHFLSMQHFSYREMDERFCFGRNKPSTFFLYATFFLPRNGWTFLFSLNKPSTFSLYATFFLPRNDERFFLGRNKPSKFLLYAKFFLPRNDEVFILSK